MKILGIETSCDETGVALLDNAKGTIQISSSIVASSLSLHATTGGIIPEVAAREQVKFILPTLTEALKTGLDFDIASKQTPDIDAIAVTYGPGLIGSLLVGVETAKTLALLWNKPLIPINHMYGHLYANWITTSDFRPSTIPFPAIVLIVSGNHTDLLLMNSHSDIQVLGGTRDDAAGEAFDKIGRLLGLPYPAGSTISRLAIKGNPKKFVLPRPMIGSDDFDFSFSGLKTATLNLVKQNKWDFADQHFKIKNEQLLANLCASVEQAIVDVLVRKTVKAAGKYNVKSILLGGGVAANAKLQTTLKEATSDLRLPTNLFVPRKDLCTDNGAMIASAAFFAKPALSWKDVDADPELYY
ncbi:MAG: tRNA (adenosine(37)-N6)-threonylcarbamoyltransferase complex transferase subunit TsaD [Patescibacteria group bacterium]